MKQKERNQLEQRLLRERERALKVLSRLDERVADAQDGDGDLTTYPLHLADEGTDTMEREKDFLLLSKEGRLVYWIDDALRTLYKQPREYGHCSECGREISLERLDLIPWARLCLSCQQMDERRQERLREAA